MKGDAPCNRSRQSEDVADFGARLESRHATSPSGGPRCGPTCTSSTSLSTRWVRNWADVTEGDPWPLGFVWERLRYEWSEPGLVKGTATDSNIFKPGSTWEIRAHPADNGSLVELVGVRHLKGKGKLLAAVFPLGLPSKMLLRICAISSTRSKRYRGPTEPIYLLRRQPDQLGQAGRAGVA